MFLVSIDPKQQCGRISLKTTVKWSNKSDVQTKTNISNNALNK
jgi:hypothetical protein